MIVRHATPGDTAALLRFRSDLWPDETGSWHAEDLASFFAGKTRQPLAILIAEDESNGPVGFADLSIRSYAEGCYTDRVAFLEGWYVVAEMRKRGVGAVLVAAAESWARAQGCTEFASDALLDNEVSAAAHHALGFTEVVRLRCFRKDLTTK